MKNPFVKECAWLDHLFLLLSSCWRRNVKWCLYLCSSGSREQVWVLMWVKNGPRCKSFHIPSHGRNNWSLTVLGSSRNTLNLKLQAFVPQLIIIYIFSRGIKKPISWIKTKKRKQYKQLTFCLWATHVWFSPPTVRLFALNSRADFPI